MLTLFKRWWQGDVELPLPSTIKTLDDLIQVQKEVARLSKCQFVTTPFTKTRLRVVQTHYSQFIRDILEMCLAVKETIKYKPYKYYQVLIEDWFTNDESYVVDLPSVCEETAHCLQQLINLCSAEVDKGHVENTLLRYSQPLLTVMDVITVCRSRVIVK